jgi:hypothetical protein
VIYTATDKSSARIAGRKKLRSDRGTMQEKQLSLNEALYPGLLQIEKIREEIRKNHPDKFCGSRA